ncbi:hypothetical protein [Methylovulum psychrotolerans]|uniref:Uncharacterized protein n=1 Tax=Methylovulum psychrotolerans TaxID=1704499 RepID=A0A2S5CQM4_9GAMM|nr:hypothetical protein [Methylovulum psychrotolerans]POZ53066.1 hypothetical protein AADEFJLK_00075 [Methylovulum psychrotolerans]
MKAYAPLVLVGCALLPACTDNIRQAPAAQIAQQTEHSSSPDPQGLTWFAPVLHLSQYRTLFFGYDTVNYRLASADTNSGFRLLIDINYGGAVRHYDFAQLDGQSRPLSHQRHIAERCQLFNSLISSCIYQDLLSLDLAAADLAQARQTGLHLQLASATLRYEALDLPANYIQGFLQGQGTAKP